MGFMMLFAVIFICLVFFLIGFLVGVKYEPPIRLTKQNESFDEDLEKLKKEYENFLSYDGSVQE